MSDFAIDSTKAETRIGLELSVFEDDGHRYDGDGVATSDGKLVWSCRKDGCHYSLRLEIGVSVVECGVELCVQHIHQPGQCFGKAEEGA